MVIGFESQASERLATRAACTDQLWEVFVRSKPVEIVYRRNEVWFGISACSDLETYHWAEACLN